LPRRIAGGNANNEGNDTEGSDDDTHDDGVDGADTDVPNVYHTKVRDLRKEFLSEFSDEEVAEMLQIDNFMMFVSFCTRNALPQSPLTICALLHFIHPTMCIYLNFSS